MKKILLICSTIFLYSFNTNFNFNTDADRDKLSVLVSIRPYYLLVNEIAKDKIILKQFIPDNISVHIYSPKITDMKKVSDADLIIHNGGGLEPNFKKILKNKKNLDIYELITKNFSNDFINKHKDIQTTTMSDDGHNHSHSLANPHFWFSIKYMKFIVKKIAVELSNLDRPNSDFYLKNSETLIKELDATYSKIMGERRGIVNISYIAFHDSFFYFNKEFNIYSLNFQESPNKEPSVKYINTLIAKVKEKNIKIIFYEPQFDANLVKKVAKKIDINCDIIDPLGTDYKNFTDFYLITWKKISGYYK